MSESLQQLLAGWQPGHALPGGLYGNPHTYERELDAIFLKSWLCIGHVSQVPRVGDYFLFDIARESVIVVRGGEGSVNALLNVCRHRGSRVCDEATGHETRLVCRYHGWSYGLDGTLRAAARMPGDFDRSRHGLRRLQARVFAGLIFVNFAPEPPDFSVIERDLAAPLAPYQLDRAKVAHRQTYAIDSDWKLAVENYCECYHCQPAHPEYSVGHSHALSPQEEAAMLGPVKARAAQAGLTDIFYVRNSWLAAGQLGTDRGYKRYALMRGHKTGSRDGGQLAPFLGSIRDFDGGATDLHFGPMMFGLAYCDHVVLYRFTPRGPRNTDCEILWLVNGEAQEGRDYQLRDLIWLWDVTTVADKRIIERNQAGVDSRYYRPGPMSEMEEFTQRFLEWYVATLRATGA
ncbi:MAG: aromatic ring-hydroxylating dioxygenase subunit alpha [Proteobacteria bacterium]|nr:aromatic ring-hydroxylating dioxygenase subunit alpha [Pseudomonadota bacterium]